MEDDVYLVVGDDYAAFARPPSVLTQSQLGTMLRDGADFTGARVFMGQGMDLAVGPLLRERLTGLGAAEVALAPPRAPLELTHKRHTDYVLVSPPERVDGRWRFALLVDDGADRLSDHVTGQHMGAMLLIEAARQAVIASIERHCPRADGASWGLILQRLDCRFDTYAFPLPTEVSVGVVESGTGDAQRELVLDVLFLQAGKRVSGIDFHVGLCRRDLLSRIEGRHAARAVAEALRQLSPKGAEAGLAG